MAGTKIHRIPPRSASLVSDVDLERIGHEIAPFQDSPSKETSPIPGFRRISRLFSGESINCDGALPILRWSSCPRNLEMGSHREIESPRVPIVVAQDGKEAQILRLELTAVLRARMEEAANLSYSENAEWHIPMPFLRRQMLPPVGARLGAA